MAGILIIAHAPLASALKECVAHIYGGLPARIGVIDVLPDSDPAQVVAFAHSEIERLREENGTLVLTDMFGATPANIASRLAALPAVRVLAGVNLPMLVRGVCYRACDLDTLVDKALAGAAKGVHAIGPLVSQAQAGTATDEPPCAAPGVPIAGPASNTDASANANIGTNTTANATAATAATEAVSPGAGAGAIAANRDGPAH